MAFLTDRSFSSLFLLHKPTTYYSIIITVSYLCMYYIAYLHVYICNLKNSNKSFRMITVKASETIVMPVENTNKVTYLKHLRNDKSLVCL